MKNNKKICQKLKAKHGALHGFAVLAIGLGLSLSASAQENPHPQVLTLPRVLAAVSDSYPTLRAVRLDARALSEDVAVAELQKWPTLTATLESYTGSSRSTPTRGVQLDHTLWDAGRNTSRIEEAKRAADVGVIKVRLQQQELFLQVTSAWQNFLSATDRAQVAYETLNRLRAFRVQMQRRVSAEASPRIDLELAESRILQTEVELKSAQSSYRIALIRLEQLSGLEGLGASEAVPPPIPPVASLQTFAESIERADWKQEVAMHPTVAKARTEFSQTKHRLEAKKSELYPQLYVRMYQPIGAIPSSDDTSLSTFIGLRYSPGAGLSSFAETKALATRIESTEQAVDTALREVEQALRSDRDEFSTSLERVASIEKSVEGSSLVLDSYQRQFQAGRKTWQDLLNAVREMGQNQYALADARAALMAAMYRLQIRTGQAVQ